MNMTTCSIITITDSHTQNKRTRRNANKLGNHCFLLISTTDSRTNLQQTKKQSHHEDYFKLPKLTVPKNIDNTI